jgi:hypothetical protein
MHKFIERAAETRLAPTPVLPDKYSQAITDALQNATKDELTTRFSVNGEVCVMGGALKGISPLRVLPDGALFVLDAVGKQAGVYDRYGNYL